MSRITKSQKYAILWLNSQSKNNHEISKELNLTTKQVNSVLKSNTKPENPPSNNLETKTKPMGSTNSRNLIIKETNNKQKVALMSKEFSMMSDEFRKKTTKPKNRKQNIYKINEKE